MQMGFPPAECSRFCKARTLSPEMGVRRPRFSSAIPNAFYQYSNLRHMECCQYRPHLRLCATDARNKSLCTRPINCLLPTATLSLIIDGIAINFPAKSFRGLELVDETNSLYDHSWRCSNQLGYLVRTWFKTLTKCLGKPFCPDFK